MTPLRDGMIRKWYLMELLYKKYTVTICVAVAGRLYAELPLVGHTDHPVPVLGSNGDTVSTSRGDDVLHFSLCLQF